MAQGKVLIPDNFNELARDVDTTMTHCTVELSKEKGYPYRIAHRGFGAAHMDVNAAWQMAQSLMPSGTVPPIQFFEQFREHSMDILNYAAQCTNKTRVTRILRSDAHTEGQLVRGFVSRKFVDINPDQVSNLIDRLNAESNSLCKIDSGREFVDPDGTPPGFYPNLETDSLLVRRTFSNLVGPKHVAESGEVYRAMVRASTGNVGAESFRVRLGLFQEACTNGLLVPVAGMAFALRGKHMGDITRKLSDWMAVAAERTLHVHKWVSALEATRLSSVETSRDEDNILDRWMRPASRHAFLVSQYGKSTKRQFQDRSVLVSPNVYGLYDAVTRWTQTQSYDMRQEIEAKVGGYILDRYMPN